MRYNFISRGFHLHRTRFRFCLVCLFLLCLLPGCTPLQQLEIIPSESGQRQTEAERLFINGDFQNALLHFEHIYDTTLSAQQKNHALYGLACTKIILAENDKQFAEGIRDLVHWDAEKGGAPLSENHHLMILALSRQGERLLDQQNKRQKNGQRQLRQINQQKKMISKLGEIMVNLQNQLKELEALDEHYQEQKRNR